MSATGVKLLQAAVEIVGGSEALAAYLAIDETLLAAYMADRRELPDRLLLKAVDIILADRRSGTGAGGTDTPAAGLLQ